MYMLRFLSLIQLVWAMCQEDCSPSNLHSFLVVVRLGYGMMRMTIDSTLLLVWLDGDEATFSLVHPCEPSYCQIIFFIDSDEHT